MQMVSSQTIPDLPGCRYHIEEDSEGPRTIPTPEEYIRMISLSRIMLPTHRHIQVLVPRSGSKLQAIACMQVRERLLEAS